MDYLKVNCFELAEINSELRHILNKLSDISMEYEELMRSIDQEMGLQSIINQSCSRLFEPIEKMSLLSSQLDKVIDIYYDMELKVKQQNEPLRIFKHNSINNSRSGKIFNYSILKTDRLLVEEWLSELLLKNS